MTARSSVVNGSRVGRKKLLRANVAGADDVKPGKIVGSMIGERDAGGIEHLQKEIPYQAVGLFNFIEQRERLAGVCERTLPKRPGLPVSSPMKSFTLSRVEEFGHVESENGSLTEKVTGKFQRQFRLPYPGRPEKKERSKRFLGGLQAKLAAFQNGTHAGNRRGPGP